MKKQITNIDTITLVGVSIRTTNANELDPKKGLIGPLVNKFFSEQLAEKIPNRASPHTSYCVYSDYETDKDGPYTYFIGEVVSDVSTVPAGFVTQTIAPGRYQKFTTLPGKMPELVVNAWQDIWSMREETLGGIRAYHTDFEVYDSRAIDPKHAVVDIYIGLKDL